MLLQVDFRKQLRAGPRQFTLAIELVIEEQFTVIFGRSGAGKTLTMQAIAGLLKPDAGHIAFDDLTWFDGERKINVRPQSRNIGYVFQDYALFPHLTVAQNVAFGRSSFWGNWSRQNTDPEVEALLERFSLGPFAASYPQQLSCGQRQRVALARAISRTPALLLLDEPLVAMDPQLRGRMRQELRTLRDELNVPMIIISHDPEDILEGAQRVIVLSEGKVDRNSKFDPQRIVSQDFFSTATVDP